MEEMLKEIKEELKGFEKGTSQPPGGYFGSQWLKRRNPEGAIAAGAIDGSDPAGSDNGASSLKKKPRKKRSDAGQKRGAKGGSEGASGSGAKGGSDPVGGDVGADGSKNKGQKRPRKKRSDAGKKRGAKGGPEGASGSGAKGVSDPAGGGNIGADGSKNKVLGSDSDSE